MTRTNGQWRLKTRPVGMVQTTDFELVEEDLPELEDGQLLVKNLFLACGISGYHDETPATGPTKFMNILARRLSVKGFIIYDHLGKAHEAIADLSKSEPRARSPSKRTSRRASRTRPPPSSASSKARTSASS